MWFQSKKKLFGSNTRGFKSKKRRMDIHSPFFCPLSIRERKASLPLLPIDTTRTRPLASAAQLRTLLPRPKEALSTYPPPIKTVVSSSGPPLYATLATPHKTSRAQINRPDCATKALRTTFTEKGPRSVARPFHNSSSPHSSGAASHSPSNRTRYHRRMFPLHAKRKRPRDTATR